MGITSKSFKQARSRGYFSEKINLAEAAAGVSTQQITLGTKGRVKAGDLVFIMGNKVADAGLIVTGCLPAPADDKVEICLNNTTALAIDAASADFHFLVVKP